MSLASSRLARARPSLSAGSLGYSRFLKSIQVRSEGKAPESIPAASSAYVSGQNALLVGYRDGIHPPDRTAGRGGNADPDPAATIWASGPPLATAITGVVAYRLLCSWLTLPPAPASLPVLREATRQATITRQAVPGTATRPRAAAGDTTVAASCARSGLAARDGPPIPARLVGLGRSPVSPCRPGQP